VLPRLLPTKTPKPQKDSLHPEFQQGLLPHNITTVVTNREGGGPLNSTRDFHKPILDDATLLNVAHAAMICDATTSKMNKTKSTQQKNRI
jgi:hypothetical protein